MFFLARNFQGEHYAWGGRSKRKPVAVSFTSSYLKLPQSPSEAELVGRSILGTQITCVIQIHIAVLLTEEKMLRSDRALEWEALGTESCLKNFLKSPLKSPTSTDKEMTGLYGP